MTSGNECPACSENIGVGAVFRAPLPNRIRCPHCGERLQYGDTWLVIAASLLLIAGVVVAGFVAASVFGLDGPEGLVVVLGTLLVGGAGLEVVFVLTLWY